MSGTEKSDRETVVIENEGEETGGSEERLDPTIDVGGLKLDKKEVDQIAQILADKFPPNTNMHGYITGFEVLGGRPRRHVIGRINVSVTLQIPGVTSEKIGNSIFEIIAAYKKAVVDVTHMIDTE